jgi:hypothetical protein
VCVFFTSTSCSDFRSMPQGNVLAFTSVVHEGVGLGKLVPRLNRKVEPTTRCRPVSALDALPVELRPSGWPGTSQVAAPCDVRLCNSASMFIGARINMEAELQSRTSHGAATCDVPGRPDGRSSTGAARTTSWAACALDEGRAWDKLRGARGPLRMDGGTCPGRQRGRQQKVRHTKEASARFSAEGANARSAGARAYASTSAKGAHAKSAGGASICQHQRERSTCNECGGASICPHQRERSRCKGCGGASICPHQRERSTCKECGGASICQHQRQRSQCNECGGGGICQHQCERSQCKECRGASICQHQRERSTCKECGGAGICQHQRIRSRCKECGGDCPHQRERSRCKGCGGASICQHQRQRSTCKECRGAGICQHQRERSRCKGCGGAGICQHQRIRSRCKECREESDTSIPAEELAGAAAHAAGKERPVTFHMTHMRNEAQFSSATHGEDE